MSHAPTRPAHPAPAATSTNRDPDTRGISPRPYSFTRPFPALPEQWQSPQAQAKLLNEYLTHDGHFATFAAQRNLSVDQLYDWLHSEAITAQRKRLSDMAQERADLLATLARPAAIEALLNLLTKGCINDNQRRLAASALLRAAASADRRQERQAKEQARAARPPTGSSSARCDAEHPPKDAAPGARSMRAAINAAAPAAAQPAPHASVPGAHRRSGTPPARHVPSARDPDAATTTGAPPNPCPAPLLPSRILARIGPAASPVPPRSSCRPKPPKRAARPRPENPHDFPQSSS